MFDVSVVYIVGSRGASQLGGSLLGIPLGYDTKKREELHAACKNVSYNHISPLRGGYTF